MSILTRANGTPYVKPEPADLPDTGAYLRASCAYRDEIADDASRAFDAAFRAALDAPAQAGMVKP